MLKSGLTVWCYKPDGSVVVGYQRLLENLEFSTAAPGGFGTLRATIKLPDARIPHPELALFSRVAVMGHGENGAYEVWLGEIMDAPIVLTSDGAEAVEVSALGIGNCLRDDQQSFAYSGKTAAQIATDQLSGSLSGGTVAYRVNAWPLDQDTSLLFPDAPAASWTLSYTNRNAEEILGDICVLAGNGSTQYIWGTTAHTRNTDAAGFPTGQLYAKQQDTSTTAYQASLMARDVLTYRIAPSSDRAYNVVQITYNDPSSGIGTATATDSRLGASGAQGTASFRRRVYTRALEGLVTVTATQASTIATALCNQYQNITNKVEIELARVRNAQGIEIPLWAVKASEAGNIYVPELAVRGSQLATSATAGTNQFFIVSTTYREGSFSGSSDKYEMSLTLECDNYVDSTAAQIARLQIMADGLSRSQRTTGNGTARGVAAKGWYEIAGVATAASQTLGDAVDYPYAPLSQAPTSITLAANFSTNNSNLRAPSANFNVWGFSVFCTSSAAGTVENNGYWVTGGNCVYDVDLDAGTFTHHCEPCALTRRGLRIARDVRVHTDEHGRVSMWVECPCGAVECCNLHLEAEDEEAPGHHHRAEQARNIRALMRHPKVGLHQLVRDCRCKECAGRSGGESREAGAGGQQPTRAGRAGGKGGRRESVPAGRNRGTDGDGQGDPRATGADGGVPGAVGGATRGDAAAARRPRGARRKAG